jgi:hypothetical protein
MSESIGTAVVAAAPRRATAPRRVRVCYFNTWAHSLEEALGYGARVPGMDLAPLVANPHDSALLQKARLDCDWYGENTRVFAQLRADDVEFLPAWVCGPAGVLDVGQAPREPGEERWLVTMGHQPQALRANAGKIFALLARVGVRHLFYAFDEASRFMPCFADIAPHLRVLIHDEAPLDPRGRALLAPTALVRHRSWVANVLPFSTPFVEKPAERILFLGSQLGLTDHRRRQIEFLQRRFGERFVAIHDHSVPVGARARLAADFSVSVCPEGRKFATLAMSASHTDRPFWSGCLGLVPVSEDSAAGGRLEELHQRGLILRYQHGNLESLAAACARALALDVAERRRIYEHFNRHETVGAVVAAAIEATASSS